MKEGVKAEHEKSGESFTDDEQAAAIAKSNKDVADEMHKKYGSGAATGAYTGDWGFGQGFGPDNGKLIKVHPKELILNKKDTSNILRAVDIVRNMNTWVDD